MRHAITAGPVLAVLPRCAAALATFPAIDQARPDACVVCFDAHRDRNLPDQMKSSYLGGLVLTGAAGLWKTGLAGGLSLAQVVLVGSRDLDASEQALVDVGKLTLIAPSLGGDTLVVWKLDRLGRDLRHLVRLVDDLTRRNIGFKVLAGEGASIDTGTVNGRLIFGIFAALAEFERELIAERTRAGLASARARRRHGGRPFKMTPAKLLLAQAAMGSWKPKSPSYALHLGSPAKRSIGMSLQKGRSGQMAHKCSPKEPNRMEKSACP